MYEAWQAQQKVQKDEERKAKSEAAAALNKYRRDGLSEEERKLADIREQERLQKMEAEKKLRDYRGKMSEEEAKAFALKQEELRRKQEMEEQLRTNGVVSAHEAGIHASLNGIQGSGAVSAMREQYNSPLKEQSVSSPREATISENGDSQPLPDSSAAPSAEPQQPVATKVSFMFGVITANDEAPEVDGYLAKADQLVKTVVMDNPNAFATIGSTVAYPVVAAVEKDNARTDINRTMVTISDSNVKWYMQ
ncbi:MAG: hypothetical protein SGARI_005750 [Bacillariaceae sp.]